MKTHFIALAQAKIEKNMKTQLLLYCIYSLGQDITF